METNSGRNEGVVFTGGSFRKGVRVPIGVPGGGVWAGFQGGGFLAENEGKRGRGWGVPVYSVPLHNDDAVCTQPFADQALAL